LKEGIHDRFGTTRTLAVLSFGLLCTSALVGLQHYGFAIFGAYVVVFLAERPHIGSRFAHRWGDLSYGLYLFGWPVEQFMQQGTAIRSGRLLFIVSLPFVVACAAISWWVVERPCLSLKKLTPRYSASIAAQFSSHRHVLPSAEDVQPACESLGYPIVLDRYSQSG
jgi:peptidoglycan/LPS O-acetylase OafA/YrhL